MPTIAHISDLHFPYVSGAALEALRTSLNELRPDLLVISGDLTQRAREKQFAAAQRFLQTLPQPQLAVPGNHDVPLYDLLRRFFHPVERFQRYIAPDLSPAVQLEGLHIVGANSTRAFTLDPHGFWKNGTLSDAQLMEISRQFADTKPSALRVLVMHHPLVNPWNAGSRDTARGRERIIRSLEQSGVQVVLSGHLHLAYHDQAPTRVTTAGRILCIQAGTATSTRLRGKEPNSFNILNWTGSKLTLTTMRLTESRFIAESTIVL